VLDNPDSEHPARNCETQILREISDRERGLLLLLGEVATIPEVQLLVRHHQKLLVEPLDDGGMGSFRICLPHEYEDVQRGIVGATLKSNDSDGVPLVATLYVNDRSFPCEVDIWKVDFSPVIEIPEVWELEDFPRFPGTGTGKD
jgi:hypothetical protein